MNNRIEDKIKELIASHTPKSQEVKKSEEEVIINNPDGLLEHAQVVNKKFVAKDGRQLLKEVRFEQ
jgi:hypothetical protein